LTDFLWNDLVIGLEQEFEHQVNPGDIDKFIDICNDYNPLHSNNEYAISQGFKKRVVHGLLTSSLYSTLVGVYLPGKYALLHSLDVSFLKPVYEDDKLKINGKIVFLSDSVKQIEIKAFITNQNNQKVSRAKIKVGMFE